MASPTLTLYKDNTTTQAYSLLTTAESFAKWIVSGRALSKPQSVTQKVKVTAGQSNDEVIAMISATEANATTGKLATCGFKIVGSIPKDQTVLTPAVQNELLSQLASLMCGTGAATGAATNRTTFIEGRML